MDGSFQSPFQGCSIIKYLSIKEMEENSSYEIKKIDRVNAKYWEAVRSILDGGIFEYLPSSLLPFTQKERKRRKIKIYFATCMEGLMKIKNKLK